MENKDWQTKGAGHRQRLREKFLSLGIAALSDSEVLELLLTLGTPRKDCKETARTALSHFGSLTAVLEAPQKKLLEIHGLGPNNVFALHFLHGVSRRFLHSRIKDKHYLHSSKEVAEFLVHSMGELTIEIFEVLLLDAGHAIIDSKTLSTGSLTTNTVYPRELIKLALSHHAAAIIIAHNHPSGSLNPSEADLRLTKNLYLACAVMGIKLLDHFIISRNNAPYSFADNGIMASIQSECHGLM